MLIPRKVTQQVKVSLRTTLVLKVDTQVPKKIFGWGSRCVKYVEEGTIRRQAVISVCFRPTLSLLTELGSGFIYATFHLHLSDACFVLAHCFHSLSLSLRSSGLSQSTWNLWPSCLSCSWSPRQARQSPSPPTTCSSWACTEPSTWPTGSGATTQRDSSTKSPWWLEWCRPSSTVTSSISMSPGVS